MVSVVFAEAWTASDFAVSFWVSEFFQSAFSQQFSTLDSVLKSQIPKEKNLRKYITFFTLFMKN